MPSTVFAPWDDPKAKPLIRFKNVTKRFGDFTAIDNLSLDIYEKEFFALLGPSGCGKTTMMRMLAGFEDADQGQDPDWPVRTSRRCRRTSAPVNMMFQSYALFPHLTVWDNIAFGLQRGRRCPRTRSTARVDEMLQADPAGEVRAAQAAPDLRRPAAAGGAGPRRWPRRPKLLLLDEPLGALDSKLRQDTQFELMDIQEKTGTTFVIVTHDQEEAMTVASRVAVMDEGQLIQVATPDAHLREPEIRSMWPISSAT